MDSKIGVEWSVAICYPFGPSKSDFALKCNEILTFVQSRVASWNRDFSTLDLFTKHLWSAKAVMHAINAVTQV